MRMNMRKSAKMADGRWVFNSEFGIRISKISLGFAGNSLTGGGFVNVKVKVNGRF
jgi:hypothetical protein